MPDLQLKIKSGKYYMCGSTLPLGDVLLVATDYALCRCDWMVSRFAGHVISRYKPCAVCHRNHIIETAECQLSEYIAGTRKSFSVPLSFSGSDFSMAVWEAVMDIDYGCFVSYSELARKAGYPKAVRAVATAVGRNPLSVFVPCHRVVRADGSLGNYAAGMALKRSLFMLESDRV